MTHSLNLLFEEAGAFGRYQFIQMIATFYAVFVGTMNTLSFIFINFAPADICPDYANDTEWNRAASQAAGNVTDTCFVRVKREICPNWTYDQSTMEQTTVSNFDLVCEKQFVAPLATTFYMIGFFLGAIVYGYISDRYGRLKALGTSSLNTMIPTLMSAFAPNIEVYIAGRFLTGIGGCGMIIVALVYQSECVVPRHRGYVGLSLNLPWTVSLIFLSLFSYFVPKYSYIQVGMSLFCLPSIVASMLLYQSPRWLLTQNRAEEAIAVIRKVASINRRSLSSGVVDTVMENDVVEDKVTIWSFLQFPGMRRCTLIIWYTFFNLALVFYGISTGIQSLSGWSLHVNMAFSTSIEFVVYLAIILMLECFRRIRLLMIGFSAMTTMVFIASVLAAQADMNFAFSMICVMIRPLTRIVFSLTGVYTVEVYPTSHRTLGLGLANCVARVAAMIAPFVQYLVNVWSPLPFVIYTILLIFVVLSFLFLPETRLKRNAETVEEAEEMMKEYLCHTCHSKKRNSV